MYNQSTLKPQDACSDISIKTNTSNYTAQHSVYSHLCLPKVVIRKTNECLAFFSIWVSLDRSIPSEQVVADRLLRAAPRAWATSQHMIQGEHLSLKLVEQWLVLCWNHEDLQHWVDILGEEIVWLEFPSLLSKERAEAREESRTQDLH